MLTPNELWIAIPTDGRRSTLIGTLSSLLQHDMYFHGLYICENGKRRPTCEDVVVLQLIKWLKALGKRVEIDYTSLPFEGFTRLRHYILDKLFNQGIKYALLLDDDVVLAPHCLEYLWSLVHKTNRLGWISPVLLYPESLNYDYKYKIPQIWQTLLCPWTPDEPEWTQNTQFVATTTCLFIDVKNAMNSGGFDFFDVVKDWGEDRVFTTRIASHWDVFVHRRALCYLSWPVTDEGNIWLEPENRLIFNDQLLSELSPTVRRFVLQHFHGI